MTRITDAQIEQSCKTLRRAIEAAENSNQAGEDFVMAAAVAPQLLKALEKALAQMERIIGWHNAPSDCYATGPLTGDAFTDLVSCPSCEGERMIAELGAIAGKARGEQDA